MNERIKQILMAAAVLLAAAVISFPAMAASDTARWKHEGGNRYYIDSRGNTVKGKWLTIGGKRYRFDENGRMLYGWHYEKDNIYYLGDKSDGSMKTGWLCLSYNGYQPPEEGDVSEVRRPGTSGAEYFYFQSNGKALKASQGKTYKMKSFSGSKYYFDKNGVMQTGWIAVEDKKDNDKTGISRFRYFGGPDDGAMAKGWYYLTEHPSDSHDSKQISGSSAPVPKKGDGCWYYFNSDGMPKYLNSTVKSLEDATVRISGDDYFFDDYGCAQAGLLRFDLGDGATLYAYFDDDGKMLADKQSALKKKGDGFTGIKNHLIYCNGNLVKAASGADFEVFYVDGQTCLVNESGRVQETNQYYQVRGTYMYEYDDGAVYRVNGDDKDRRYQINSWSSLPALNYKGGYGQK